MSAGRPVEEFLGAAAAAGGPFALLGLAPEDCTQELIIVQLQRQLRRVAAHAEGASPEADEVRLALHAAAARLLEGLASVGEDRGEGRDEAAVERAAEDVGTDELRETREEGLTSGMIAMERDILVTVAQCGGWNKESLHRLGMIAHSRGVSPEEFLGAIQALQRGVVGGGGRGRERAAAGRVGARGLEGAAREEASALGRMAVQPDEADPTMRVITAGAVVIVVGLVLLGGAIFVVAKLTGGGASGGAGAGPTAVVGPGEDGSEGEAALPRGTVPQVFPKGVGEGEESGSGEERRPEVVGQTRDVASLIRDVRSSVEMARENPAGALEEFVEAVRGARVLWTRATPDQITALQDAVVEFVYRIGGASEEGRAAVGACVEGVRSLGSGRLVGADVRGAIFSAGLAARLSRERELPAETVDMLAGLLRGGFFRTLSIGEMSFKGGATSACVEMGRRLVPGLADPIGGGEKESVEAWGAWIECVGALGLDGPMRERMVLRALEELVLRAPEPNRNRATLDAIGITASSLGWGAGEESRGKLMRWFEDPEVTAADLYAVTTAVVGKGLAVGVDSSMVLSAAASESARSDLKERYHEAWGMGDVAVRSQASLRLIEVAVAALAEERLESVEGRLSTALWFSRLSEAAGAVWAGKPSALVEGREVVPGGTGSPPAGSVLTYTTNEAIESSSWAVQYLAVRTRIPERREMLAKYQKGSGNTLRLEAAVIVEEAVRGSPSEVRRDASRIVRDEVDDPVFVEAMLNESATMPLTRENALLASQVSRGSLLSVRNPGFRVSLRRALVERLLELLSAEGDMKRIEEVGERMARSYQARAKVAADAAGREGGPRLDDVAEGEGEEALVAAGPVPPLERSSRLLRLALEEEAKRALPSGKEIATLEEIRTVRAARGQVARGRLQRFAAEQAGLVDLLAYVVVAGAPTRVEEVRGVVEGYTASRRAARHVSEQIEAGERAMLELWVLRMKGEGA